MQDTTQTQYQPLNQTSQSSNSPFGYSPQNLNSECLRKLEAELSSGFVNCYVIWLHILGILSFLSLLFSVATLFMTEIQASPTNFVYPCFKMCLCWFGITAVKNKSLTRANYTFYMALCEIVILIFSLVILISVKFSMKFEDPKLEQILNIVLFIFVFYIVLLLALNLRGSAKVRDILTQMNQAQLNLSNNYYTNA